MPLYILALFLSLSATLAQAQQIDNFSYPDINAFMSTIGGTPGPLRAPVPDDVDVRQTDLSVRVLPERRLPPALDRYRDLHYRLAYQNKPAPLIFLIAGTGSSFNSPRLAYLKALFWQAGMHVIMISSPTNHDFIAAASSTGLPGLGREDARDLHTAMSLAVENAREKQGIEITEYRMAGFSLGALNAAFVSHLDASLGQFNFSKVLLLNPPVDLYSSIQRLDALSRTKVAGISNTDSFYEHIFDKLSRHFAQSGETDVEAGLFTSIQTSEEALTDGEMALLIGAVFRFAAADLNFMTDVINGTGRYAPPGATIKVSTSLTPYLRRALFCDFNCYIQSQLWPSWSSRNIDKSINDMAYETSLRSIEGHLIDNPKVAVISNADDFILDAGDYAYLAELFDQRAFLFPRGGHGGNLQHVDVTARMLSFLEGTR
ncbi:MAG: serine/threonine protein kinase [Halopseudomonas sp.]